MKTLEEKIAVMQAHAAGKPVQCKHYSNTWDWVPVVNPIWNWVDYDFRIAPEKLTIYIYRSKSTHTVFPSNVELFIPNCSFVKKIEVEV